jgi:hypothetical protein
MGLLERAKDSATIVEPSAKLVLAANIYWVVIYMIYPHAFSDHH